AILSYGSVTTGETMQARVTYGFSVSDSSSFTFPSLSPAPSMGTSLIGYFTLGGNNNLGVTTHAGGSVLIQGSYIQHLVATDVANINIGFGSRVDTAVFTDCRHVQVLNTSLDFPAIIASTTGYAYTLIGSGSCSPYKSGLVLRNSSLALGDKVYFPQNTGHAIECERSFLILSGNLSGSGHTNFALYAHTNSTVLVGASTPTGVTSILSGSKGYITTDGIIQATDWSTVYGGVIYTDLNELVLIKKQEHL
ncbi:MAG: hypothetical protein Q8P81_04340, partial [Nanoarchaeota archaeon]|nr:hypothetical protein [Nanoarchaeota archaeon]